MTDVSRITGRDRRPAFYLWVAGIDTLYGTVQPPDRMFERAPSESGIYNRRTGILPDKGFKFDRRLDVEDHVITSRPVDVFLVSDLQYDPLDPLDPGEVFGRMGFVGADAVVQFAFGQVIEQDDALPITVICSSDPSTLFSPGDLVHIGRECFHVSATNSGAKSITFDARARLGTVPQRHATSNASGTRPHITKPAVYFKGRRAIIFENDVLSDGSVDETKWVERWRGFILSEPEPGVQGAIHTIRLQIAPLTALLDRPLGNRDDSNFISKDFHAFGCSLDKADNEATHKTEIHLAVHAHQASIYFENGPGRAVIPKTENGYYGFNQEFEGVPVVSFQEHLSVFDETLPHVAHPRRGPIMPNSETLDTARDSRQAMYLELDSAVPTAYVNNHVWASGERNNCILASDDAGAGANSYGNTQGQWLHRPRIGERRELMCWDEFDQNGNVIQVCQEVIIDGNLEIAGTPGWDGEGYGNANTVEWHSASMLDPIVDWPQVHRWPQQLLKQVNVTYFNRATAKGASGMLVGAFLNNTDPANPFWVFTTEHARRGEVIKVSLVNDFPHWSWTNRGDMPLHIGHNWTDPTNPKRRDHKDSMVAEAVLMGEEPTTDEGTGRTSQTVMRAEVFRDNPSLVPTRIANTFYQKGERFLVLTRPFVLPAGDSLFLMLYKVTADDESDEAGAGEFLTVYNATAVNQRVIDGVEYYIATVSDTVAGQPGRRVKSWAIYNPFDHVRVDMAFQFGNEPIGETLLKLLCSSGGRSTTSTEYDTLEFGAELLDGSTAYADLAGADIDVASFLAIPSPVPGARVSASLIAGETIIDAVVGLLRAVGYTMDIRTGDDGKCQLVAMPLGLPNESDVVASIGETDIADTNVQSPAEYQIFNSFKFTFNYDPTDPDHEPVEQTIRDAVSINTFAETTELAIPMRGIKIGGTLDFVSVLAPIFSRLRREFGFPRRVFRLDVRSGLAPQMRIGGTYRLTHSLLRGVRGIGVTDALVRLRKVTHDGFKSTAKCEFVFYGEGGSGWGPSLTISSVHDATSVVVGENVHSRPRNRTSGEEQEDLNGFSILLNGTDRRVYVSPPGDMDGGQVLTVQSIDTGTNKITFTAAHGLALNTPAGGRVTAIDWQPPAVHEKYGYIDRVLVI